MISQLFFSLNGGNMPTTVTKTNCSGKVRQIESGSCQVTRVTGLTDDYFKRPVHPDDHLQMAGPSGWSFARGWSLQIIICKRPVHMDDHLQDAGPSGWSFAGGWFIYMIICERLIPSDDHLQEAGPFEWSFSFLVVVVVQINQVNQMNMVN